MHRLPGDAAPSAKTAPASGFEMVRRFSPPLSDILTVVNKESQNLHAELLLDEVGRARGRDGSRAAGLELLRSFLADAGVPVEEKVAELQKTKKRLADSILSEDAGILQTLRREDLELLLS